MDVSMAPFLMEPMSHETESPAQGPPDWQVHDSFERELDQVDRKQEKGSVEDYASHDPDENQATDQAVSAREDEERYSAEHETDNPLDDEHDDSYSESLDKHAPLEDPMERAWDRRQQARDRALEAREQARSNRVESTSFLVAGAGRDGLAATMAQLVSSTQHGGRSSSLSKAWQGNQQTKLMQPVVEAAAGKTSVEDRLQSLLTSLQNPRTFQSKPLHVEKPLPFHDAALKPSVGGKTAHLEKPIHSVEGTKPPSTLNESAQVDVNRELHVPKVAQSKADAAGRQTQGAEGSDRQNQDRVPTTPGEKSQTSTQRELQAREAKAAANRVELEGQDRQTGTRKASTAKRFGTEMDLAQGVTGSKSTATNASLGSQALSRSVVVSRIPEQVSQMMEQGQNKLELRLDPPHLGKLNVSISRQADHVAVKLVVQTQHAGDALKSMQSEMLQKLGLEINDAVELSIHVESQANQGDGGYAQHQTFEEDDAPSQSVSRVRSRRSSTQTGSVHDGAGLHLIA